MSRIGNHVGGYATATNRKSLLVVMYNKGQVLAEGLPVPGLGFAPNAAYNARRAFANDLKELSSHLANCRDVTLQEVDPAAQATEDGRLRLSDADCDRFLRRFREHGAPLRRQLSAALVNRLRFYGFLAGNDEPGPELTFMYEEDSTPILWEMMYENASLRGDPDWQQFWGFRVPIAHWMPPHAGVEEIRLHNSLLSAVTEDLSFTEQEVNALVRRLQEVMAGLRHRSLAEAFREMVCRDWPGGQVPLAGWLHHFLETVPEYRRESWKQEALVELFTDPRFRSGVVHFACHCAPSEQSEFQSKLIMHVAGEEVSLNVALMETDLRRERRSDRDPGPLVFLNACGTGKQTASREPPGFPASWINCGALAVVATLCHVPDSFAHAFALKFYEILLEDNRNPDSRRSVAEALLMTRRFFMETWNNPLGLAYVLYAWRGARILPGITSPGANP